MRLEEILSFWNLYRIYNCEAKSKKTKEYLIRNENTQSDPQFFSPKIKTNGKSYFLCLKLPQVASPQFYLS